MGEHKFTPGPWRMCIHLRDEDHDQKCPCCYRGGIWSGDGEALICEMGGTPEVDGVKFLPEADRPAMLANARLIAAAPEMFEALIAQRISDLALEGREEFGNWLELEEHAVALRAKALAVATGEAGS